MRSHEDQREEQAALERRCALLAGEGEETRVALDSAERARKALETELQEVNDKFSDLNNQVGAAPSHHGSDLRFLPLLEHSPFNLHCRCARSVPVSPEWEAEAGGGSPDSAAGARGDAGGAEGIDRESQEGQL